MATSESTNIEQPQFLFDHQSRRSETLARLRSNDPSVIGACEEEIEGYVSASVWLDQLRLLSEYVKEERETENFIHGAGTRLARLKQTDAAGRQERQVPDEIADALGILVMAKEAGSLYSTGKEDPLKDIETDFLRTMIATLTDNDLSKDGEIARRVTTMREEQTQIARTLETTASAFTAENMETIEGLAEKIRGTRRAGEKAETDRAIKEARENVGGGGALTTRPSEGTIFDPLMQIVEQLHRLENFDVDESTGESKEINIKKSLADAGIGIAMNDDLNTVLCYIMTREKEAVAALAAQDGTMIQKALSTSREINLDRQFKEGLVRECEGILKIVEIRPNVARLKTIIEGRGILTAWRETLGDDESLGNSYEERRGAWQKAINEGTKRAETELGTAEERLAKARTRAMRAMRITNGLRVAIAVLLAGLAGVSGRYIGRTTGLSEADVETLVDTARDEGLAGGEATGRQAAFTELATRLNIQTPEGQDPTVEEIAAAMQMIIDAAVATNADTAHLETARASLEQLIQTTLDERIYIDAKTAFEKAGITDPTIISRLETDGLTEAIATLDRPAVQTAWTRLLRDLKLRVALGDSAGPALTAFRGLRTLDYNGLDLIRVLLEQQGGQEAAIQVIEDLRHNR